MKQKREDKYPFAVYATQFHGGRLLSRHATREAAEQAARRWRMTDCVCGCAVVIGPYAIGGEATT